MLGVLGVQRRLTGTYMVIWIFIKLWILFKHNKYPYRKEYYYGKVTKIAPFPLYPPSAPSFFIEGNRCTCLFANPIVAFLTSRNFFQTFQANKNTKISVHTWRFVASIVNEYTWVISLSWKILIIKFKTRFTVEARFLVLGESWGAKWNSDLNQVSGTVPY